MYTLEDLDEMEDDALAALAVSMPEEARKLNAVAGKAALLIRQRMVERGATKLDTEHFAGRLATTGYSYEIEDGHALWSALMDAGMNALEIEAARPTQPMPAPRWDMRALNELAKRGGAIREAIERYRVSTPNEARLEIKEKVTA